MKIIIPSGTIIKCEVCEFELLNDTTATIEASDEYRIWLVADNPELLPEDVREYNELWNFPSGMFALTHH